MYCFISYNTEDGKPLSDKVRAILLHNGVDPIDAFDISIEDSVLDEIQYKIKKCDIFVAIVTNFSPKVFYEIGIAKGLNKSIFVVLSKDLNVYPSFLNDFLYVKANLNDEENIDFAFKQLLKNQSKQRSKANKKKKKYSHDTILDFPREWKSDLKRIRENGTPLDLEKYIAGIFDSLRTTSKMVEQDKGVDFALWLDDINFILGNPVLIEAKYGNITSDMLKSGEYQLLHHLIKTKSRVGLLFYLDKTGKRFSLGSSLSPLMIRVDLEDFLSEVEKNGSITKTILDKRNAMAHGKEI
ncbi:toll/interleukin-1 receptor domain-containing protein [Paenibacillus xylanexedens]|uniref:toll/interleukin-1 receptor domain-containing protein n=1 Tax=Paenibacillus xylanexedens TaxID=528191 RepID=UPI0011A38503|nr:toll/interleukin-1 receptor domain-containing protein [Paenibacillus xylanexedens]